MPSRRSVTIKKLIHINAFPQPQRMPASNLQHIVMSLCKWPFKSRAARQRMRDFLYGHFAFGLSRSRNYQQWLRQQRPTDPINPADITHTLSVSVIVPNYNYARFITERLASISRQSWPILELIILDDASSDASIPAIDKCLSQHNNARLIANTHNSGSGYAQWRKGVSEAQGDLIWIAEADDLCDAGFLRAVLPAFNDDSVVMSYAQSKQISEDGAVFSQQYLHHTDAIDTHRWMQPYVASGEDEIKQCLSVKNTLPNVSAVVFRSSALKAVFDKDFNDIASYRYLADWKTYFHVLQHGAIAFWPAALNSHRMHDKSVIGEGDKLDQVKEMLRIQTQIASLYNLDEHTVSLAATYAREACKTLGIPRKIRTALLTPSPR